MTAASPELPPGVHLQATWSPSGLPSRQSRLLGDEERGYLITGIADLEDGDFWFETLDAALVQGERLGVSRSAWTEIVDVNEVKML